MLHGEREKMKIYTDRKRIFQTRFTRHVSIALPHSYTYSTKIRFEEYNFRYRTVVRTAKLHKSVTQKL